MQVELLNLFVFVLHFLCHEFDQGDLRRDFFFKTNVLVAILRVCLFESQQALFFELELHFEALKLLLFGFIPVDVASLGIVNRVSSFSQFLEFLATLLQLEVRSLQLQLQ